MPVPVLPVVGAVAAMVAIVAMLRLLERRRRQARDIALAADASRRGWTYTSTNIPRRRIERWQGSGLSGAWTAEIEQGPGRKPPGVRLFRWWNAAPDAGQPITGPTILLVPLADRSALPPARLGGGTFEQFAERAAQRGIAYTMDHRTGGTANWRGRLIQMIDGERRIVAGFAVLSDQRDETLARLSAGLVSTLQQRFAPMAWDGERARHPWIALVGDRVAIACTARLAPQLADVLALVDAGSAVARWRD
jgi:hypothetical protein